MCRVKIATIQRRRLDIKSKKKAKRKDHDHVYTKCDKMEAMEMIGEEILHELYRRKHKIVSDHQTSKVIQDLTTQLQHNMALEHMNSAIYMSPFVEVYGGLIDDTDRRSVMSTLHINGEKKEGAVDAETPSRELSTLQSTVVPGFAL